MRKETTQKPENQAQEAGRLLGSRSAAGGPAGGAAPRGEDPRVPPPSCSLESIRNSVGGEKAEQEGSNGSGTPFCVDSGIEEEVQVEKKVALLACGCRSRFCSNCCPILASKLKARVKPVLKTFTSMLMYTLTIDPTLFESPAQAYEYCCKHRCVTEWVRALKKAGVLHTERYFYVVEWQKNGMPHWHILLDASFIDQKAAQDLWGRHRPTNAGPIAEKRPAFGIVYVTKSFEKKWEYAANYALKYLSKMPQDGYPEWVLDSKRIRRFATSRNFFGEATKPSQKQAEERPGEVGSEEQSDREELTIRQRIAKCGEAAVLLEETKTTRADGESVTDYRFIEKFPSFNACLEQLGLLGYPIQKVYVSPEEEAKLRGWQVVNHNYCGQEPADQALQEPDDELQVLVGWPGEVPLVESPRKTLRKQFEKIIEASRLRRERLGNATQSETRRDPGGGTLHPRRVQDEDGHRAA